MGADEAAGVLAPSFAQRQADAMGVIAECALAGGLDRGTAGDRYQVVVHVDADALVEEPDVPAGTPAASYTSGCPGRVAQMPAGSAMGEGNFRRALAARDRLCRFPGCQNRRCDAHHVQHWADGGATALDNLVLLCRPLFISCKLFLLNGIKKI